MSPACNGSTALQRFERGNAFEIRNGIISIRDCHIWYIYSILLAVLLHIELHE